MLSLDEARLLWGRENKKGGLHVYANRLLYFFSFDISRQFSC